MKNIKPNLFLVGAAKSGTSTLHDYLSAHNTISGHKSKEPHFFCKNKEERELHRDSYIEGFEGIKNKQYYLDSSTGYLRFYNSIENIKQEVPDAKIIIILRNPIERLISHYQWLEGCGEESKDFMSAIEYYGDEKPNYYNPDSRMGYKHYLSWGLYGEQIDNVFKYFSKESIHILFFEDLVVDKNKCLSEIFYFLQLNDYEEVLDLNLKSNESIQVKNKFFYRLVHELNFGIFRKCFPLKFKEKIREIKKRSIKNMETQSKGKEKLKLTTEERTKIINFYRDDINRLKISISKLDKEIPWVEFK